MLHCNSLYVLGPSGSGKTTLAKNIINQLEHIAKEPCQRIIYVYNIYQEIFNQMNVDVFIQDGDDMLMKLHKSIAGKPCLGKCSNKKKSSNFPHRWVGGRGCFECGNFFRIFPHFFFFFSNASLIVVFDDLILSKNLSGIAAYFAIQARHLNLSLLFLSQKLFINCNYYRQISANSNYCTLMNNNRNKAEISTLSRQLSPGSNDLIKYYNDATENGQKGYSYLSINMSQEVVKTVQFLGEFFQKPHYVKVYNKMVRNKILKDESSEDKSVTDFSRMKLVDIYEAEEEDMLGVDDNLEHVDNVDVEEEKCDCNKEHQHQSPINLLPPPNIKTHSPSLSSTLSSASASTTSTTSTSTPTLSLWQNRNYAPPPIQQSTVQPTSKSITTVDSSLQPINNLSSTATIDKPNETFVTTTTSSPTTTTMSTMTEDNNQLEENVGKYLQQQQQQQLQLQQDFQQKMIQQQQQHQLQMEQQLQLQKQKQLELEQHQQQQLLQLQQNQHQQQQQLQVQQENQDDLKKEQMKLQIEDMDEGLPPSTTSTSVVPFSGSWAPDRELPFPETVNNAPHNLGAIPKQLSSNISLPLTAPISAVAITNNNNNIPKQISTTAPLPLETIIPKAIKGNVVNPIAVDYDKRNAVVPLQTSLVPQTNLVPYSSSQVVAQPTTTALQRQIVPLTTTEIIPFNNDELVMSTGYRPYQLSVPDNIVDDDTRMVDLGESMQVDNGDSYNKYVLNLPLKCDVCDTIFDNHMALRIHRTTGCTGPGAYPCLICGKSIGTKGALSSHMKAMHTMKKRVFGGKKIKLQQLRSTNRAQKPLSLKTVKYK